MGRHETLYLFGDQTFDVEPHLHTLLDARRNNPVLTDFLDRVYDTLRARIFQVPAGSRSGWPTFTAIEDVLRWKSSQHPVRCVAWDMALTCIYQLGFFIVNHMDREYPTPETARLLGLCTGTLAAVTVGCSHSLSDLVSKAVQATLVAFNVGLCVSNTAARFTSDENRDRPWFVMVAGSTAVQAVQNFCSQSSLPAAAKPFISAYTPNGIAVSGPPSSLDSLVAGLRNLKLKFRYKAVFAPYHAPHLYSMGDIEEILQHLATEQTDMPSRSSLSVMAGDGQIIEESNHRDALQVALEHILLKPIQWHGILDSLRSSIDTSVEAQNYRLDVYGSRADALLRSALKVSGIGLDQPPPTSPTPAGGDSNPTRPKIAIIGMSGRFPGGANSCDAFWDVLKQGLDVHEEVPPLHWSQAHIDPTGSRKNTSATPFGCWLNDPAGFDARFFNISPREAPQIDPAQRLALMTAYEALEQAGVVADATPSTRRDRVGVFYGVTSNDWMETNSAQDIDTYFIPGGNRAFIPGRINYFFKFSGPSYATDTACSSSLAAIHTAINSLWQRDIDTAIAGGTNVLTNPDFTSGLDRGHFLSRTGNCKTFDDSADGYCRGEAIGTVILKRLDDAIAEHDPILGVIVGAYTNHSAQAESITRPHTGAQRAIFSKILNSSNVDGESVGYVEMHGTGTQAGDSTEMSSTLSVFAPPDRPARASPVYLGSAKSNIGHGEAASGVSSLIKVLLMMKNNGIPPHVGIKTKINHKFPQDLEKRNVHIAKRAVDWSRNGATPRRAFVNNFSAAGGNTALLLEDAPHSPVGTTSAGVAMYDSADALVAVSAKTGTALKSNLASLKTYLLEQKTQTSTHDLSYTTTARRMHHAHRVMLVGSSVDDLIAQIDTAIESGRGVKRPKSKTPNLLFTFTGQGAQFPGMGRRLMETFPLFRTELRQLDHLARSLGFPSIMPVYLANKGQTLDDFPPIQVQLASVSMQIALTRLWASWNVRPQAVVGHSLGEYAALNVAGVLCDADTLYLVGKRAELLQRLCSRGTHCMLVVRASESVVRSTLGATRHQIACMNSPIETVLAGPEGDISKAVKVFASANIKTTRLEIPYAFHSSQVDPILTPFETAAACVNFLEPKCPVLCPLDGSVVTTRGKFSPAYLARHCRESVNLLQALSTARGQGIISDSPILLEIGPHPAVAGMIKATLGAETSVISAMNRTASTKMLADAFRVLYEAGTDIEWRAYHDNFETAARVITDLPAYNWDLKPYWIQYVNDWSLRKGEAANVASELASAVALPSKLSPHVAIQSRVEKRPELVLQSTTIHRIVRQSSSPDGMSEAICVEADISRPDMNPLVQGHMVDDVPLCTPSVYADMALTLGKYLVTRRTHIHQQVDVADMSIFKALIARSTGPQPLHADAEVDWTNNEAAVRFLSFDSKGKLQEHAKCKVRFTDRNILLEKLRKDAASIKSNMERMRQGIAKETTSRFNRAMVYRMIRPLAQFHDDYRAIDEVILNSSTLEAFSTVSFGAIKKEGTFALHPAIIDSFTQSCGFTMNCNDHTDLDKEVYMNHGWAGFQVFEDIHYDRPYTSYTRMFEGKDKIWNGDVTIFDGERVVAAFEKIEIQCVPRRVLKVILSLESGVKRNKSTAPVATAPTKTETAPRSSPEPSSAISNAPISPLDVSRHDTISSALRIISEESGVALEDLSDSTIFADLGIDSLLGLSIGANFREQLDMDLDFDSVFLHYPTVGELKTFISGQYPNSHPENNGHVEKYLSADDQVSNLPGPKAVHSQRSTDNSAEDPRALDMSRILSIVSEESGLDLDELTDETNLADTGIDSLLGLVITSRFREELDLSMPMDTLFVDCASIADLKRYLNEAFNPSGAQDVIGQDLSSGPPSSDTDTDCSTPASSDESDSAVHLSSPDMTSDTDVEYFRTTVPRATSLCLQGNPKTATHTLFLFPDGCGSASSYAQLPNLAPDTCVVALNCPFLKSSDQLRKARLDDLVTDGYLAEIQRRQPHGPYHLGGWSAGGILAYRATQILRASGEQVLSLNLIDSPAPIRGLDRLPPHFYEYCESLHLFGHKSSAPGSTGKPPAWLIPHFNATIDLLHEYCAGPLSSASKLPFPRVNLLWAATSISDNPRLPKLAPHPDDTEGMKFLLEKRTDFGGNGWENLFPGHDMFIRKVENAHHFSMMREPYAQKLAEFLKIGMGI